MKYLGTITDDKDLVTKEYVDSSTGAVVDDALSDTSENAVQNKVIKNYVDSAVPEVETPTVTITVSTGSLVTKLIRKYGNVVQLLVRFKNTASVAQNGTVFAGTISQSDLRPAFQTRNIAYYGAQAIFGWVEPDGTITLRNESSSAIQNKELNIDFTYITP